MHDEEHIAHRADAEMALTLDEVYQWADWHNKRAEELGVTLGFATGQCNKVGETECVLLMTQCAVEEASTDPERWVGGRLLVPLSLLPSRFEARLGAAIGPGTSTIPVRVWFFQSQMVDRITGKKGGRIGFS